MYRLLIVFTLLACSKTYTTPEIGMPYYPDFRDLCSYALEDRQHTVTTESGDATTIETIETDHKGAERPAECVGKFIFVNNKLSSIEH